MIKINIPNPDLIIKKKEQSGEPGDPDISKIYGFTDYVRIPKDKSGIYMFFNQSDELLFAGKARKLKHRIRKNFEDNVSPIKNNRSDINKIAVIYVDEAMDREIYETYIINTLHAKYNVDKVFYK
ncbi:nucleotide excision repair endonuclease [Falsibacillus albus]|uniref:Nucleotide excision repair endonuclease n=1 Tax=Falsibacillus albus TaxID=2478915 RepID=A0A3L7K185_9BACI|nr:nucleotide excision repair endonuclease [Falsibacillus albus]RLQ96114.1 nucleotide excision repair endonuclease [Falsibacillus albus]